MFLGLELFPVGSMLFRSCLMTAASTSPSFSLSRYFLSCSNLSSEWDFFGSDSLDSAGTGGGRGLPGTGSGEPAQGMRRPMG